MSDNNSAPEIPVAPIEETTPKELKKAKSEIILTIAGKRLKKPVTKKEYAKIYYNLNKDKFLKKNK